MPSNLYHHVPCSVATHWIERVLGLMGKKPPFRPLFIPQCWGVHTYFLRAPISLIWLDPFSQIVRIDRHVHPWKTRTCKQAVSVLEFQDDCFPDDIQPKDTIHIFPLKK